MITQADEKARNSQSGEIPDQGIAAALMFLIPAALLYLDPDYFGSAMATRFVSAVLAVVGVIGLGIEIAKLESGKRVGIGNLGFGLSFGLLWAALHFSRNVVWVNIVAFVFLMPASYGLGLAAIGIARSLRSPLGSTEPSVVKRLSLVMGQLAGFVLTVLQIVQIARGN